MLTVNQQSVPVGDLLCFETSILTIDRLQVDELLDVSLVNSGKAYTPDTSMREAGKLATQAMYQDWNTEYLERKRDPKNINRVDFNTWCAKQIAKLPIAQGCDYETIRKNMK